MRIRFLGDTVLAKAVCLIFLAITCNWDQKQKKERDLKVTSIVFQIVIVSNPVLGKFVWFSTLQLAIYCYPFLVL